MHKTWLPGKTNQIVVHSISHLLFVIPILFFDRVQFRLRLIIVVLQPCQIYILYPVHAHNFSRCNSKNAQLAPIFVTTFFVFNNLKLWTCSMTVMFKLIHIIYILLSGE